MLLPADPICGKAVVLGDSRICHILPEGAAAADTLIHARSHNGVKPLSSRREGIVPMGILCADSAIGTMGD